MRQRYIILVAALFAALGCVKEIPVQTISVDPQSKTLIEEETCQISYIVSPEDASNLNVFWQSSDSDVASVTQSGLVTALRPGTATITVSSQDCPVSATSTITVVEKHIYSSEIKLSSSTLNLVVGDNATLVGIVIPTSATLQSLDWSTSDPSIAFVQDGVVTAVAPGEADITVSNGECESVCHVTVTMPVSALSLDKSSITLYETETMKLTATVTPDNASDKSVSWQSLDETVATVSDGVVTAVSAGNTQILCTNAYGQFAYCSVTVKCHVESVTLDMENLTLFMNQGSVYLTATVLPERATDKSVSWICNNDKVIVSPDGRVTPNAPGYCKVLATTNDKGIVASCNVSVIESEISIAPAKYSIVEGEEGSITIGSNSEYTLTNSNPSVATVTKDGKVKALKPGTTTVCATTVNGGKHATCEIEVRSKVTGLDLQPLTGSLYTGESITLQASTTPAGACDLEWTVSDETMATVAPESNGYICKVTARKAGEVTVTVTTDNGQFSKQCTLTILQHVKSISLDKTALDMKKGESYSLKATVAPSDATNQKVEWRSLNAKVAAVDGNGKVTAVGGGRTTIYATTDDTDDSGKKVSAACEVSVTVPVTGVKLSQNQQTLTLESGSNTCTLTATVLPEDADNKSVKWSSSDPLVATVSQAGIVQALKVGTAVISVKTDDGSFEDKCTVTVKAASVHVSSVLLDKSGTLTLKPGETLTLKETVLPENATDKSVVWTSDNPSVASVQDGAVKALTEGTATITVSSVDDASKRASVTVVVSITHVTGVAISPSVTQMMSIGESKTFTATVSPADADDQSCTWTSSKPSVAKVEGNGKVTAMAEGEATITVKTKDGGYTASCLVKVVSQVVYVKSVTLNTYNQTLNVGDRFKLVATVNPSNYNVPVTWEVATVGAVVSVSSDGTVTALKAGSANVLCRYQIESGRTATVKCSFTVNSVPVSSVSLDKTEITLREGESMALSALLNPTNATNKNVTWSSGDSRVASVSPSGVVTGVKSGTTMVTVTTKDGNKTASCKVTVKSSSAEPGGSEPISFEEWN